MIRTDWDNVAQWYDEYLEGNDTYQEKVIAPNLVRVLALKKGMHVLDVACGSGYFSRLVSKHGVTVTGVDQSVLLIKKAQEYAIGHGGKEEVYIQGDAEKLGALNLATFDRIFCVLAVENIKNVASTLGGIGRALKDEGKVVLVLLHPAFRTPKHTDWGYSKTRDMQYRTVDKYLSEVAIPIALSPHKGTSAETTTTFHRPLQWYMKMFRNAGFVVSGMEEWISHKTSDPGPRQKAEDAARKEIPLFLCLELQKAK